MSELNKDGLVPGQEVDFITLMRINNKRNKAAKNGAKANTKSDIRRTKKPSVSDVFEAKETKEAQVTT